MKTFEIVARDADGKRVIVCFNAPSEQAARHRLRTQGLTPSSLHERPRPDLADSQNPSAPDRRLKMRCFFHGIEISLPAPRFSSRHKQTLKQEFKQLGVSWLLIGLPFLLRGDLWPVSWATLVWVGSWVVGAAISSRRFLHMLCYREKIRIVDKSVTLSTSICGIPWGKFRRGVTYELAEQPASPIRPEKGLLVAGNHIPDFCQDLNPSEAQHVHRILADLTRFSWHAAETIVFGTAPQAQTDQSFIVYNPDVTTLTVPFRELKTLEIHPLTYDMRLLERFLTYAVNYLGRELLKKHIDVHVYGKIATLHPNIRNNLLMLFKEIHEYDTANHTPLNQQK